MSVFSSQFSLQPIFLDESLIDSIPQSNQQSFRKHELTRLGVSEVSDETSTKPTKFGIMRIISDAIFIFNQDNSLGIFFNSGR